MARALSSFPFLARLRQRDISWRKLIDTVVTQRDKGRILLIDTDVVVRRWVSLPQENGIFYTREDIPAYRGSWSLPLQVPLVLSFNSGFVLFDPADVPLHFLETLCRRYFLRLGFTWWTEQAAWAALAARLPARFRFKGTSACTLSGLATRTPEEVRSNRVRFLSSPQRLNGQQLAAQAGTAPVVHMSGMAKHHFQAICEGSEADPPSAAPTALVGELDEPISLPQRLVLAARLLALNIKDSRRN